MSILERFGEKIPLREPEVNGVAATASIGVSGSVTIGPVTYGIQLAVVTDSFGSSELQFTYFTPISSSALKSTPSVAQMVAHLDKAENQARGLDWSLMGNMSIYNAPRASDLRETGYQIGGALGNGYAVCVDYNIVPNKTDSPYTGITLSAGKGSSDLHAAMGYTHTIPVEVNFNVFEFANFVSNSMWGIY